MMQYAMSWSAHSPNVCVNVYPENENDEKFLAMVLEQHKLETLRLVVQKVTMEFEVKK